MKMTGVSLAMVMAVLLVPACGDGDPLPPEEIADAYAKELSGGETLGCSSAGRGEESERNPGCIYSAAFAGCLEGLTGEQVGPLPVEEEFDQEPELVAIHETAVEECAEQS